ncbi:unnamed protein product [Microthlaspi erraticum]|uniref:Uncharacterized protein n=1 Tax=Microthlaspi erraticum TaxID=1685480 RepID=A0A6D2KDA0_9BRAS|nr:unnamed protein product [Microthlaspi erraticum]
MANRAGLETERFRLGEENDHLPLSLEVVSFCEPLNQKHLPRWVSTPPTAPSWYKYLKPPSTDCTNSGSIGKRHVIILGLSLWFSRYSTLYPDWFADIIVKAKCRKLIEESGGGNRADAMMRIKKERLLLLKKQREEKSRIEARALKLKLRREARLAAEKTDEEARNDVAFEDGWLPEWEIANLCGGARNLRSRFWFREFGLVLRPDGDYDDKSLETRDDIEEGRCIRLNLFTAKTSNKAL